MFRPDIDDHAAVVAWRRLQGAGVAVERVDVLKESRRWGRGVYRLAGAAPDGTAVIAKRRMLNDTFRRECEIYQQFLPQGPLDGLRFYGCLDETNAPFGWLFVEDAGGDEYSPHTLEHRQLAGAWLGTLHAQGHTWHGAEQFGQHDAYPPPDLVSTARAPLLSAQEVARFQGTDALALFDRLLTLLEEVDARMPRITDLCQRAPRSIIHGDFVANNLCIRTTEHGTRLASLDWESAGVGCPIMDLHQADFSNNKSWASADIDAYWSVVGEHWTSLDLATVAEWARTATILRCVTVIGWDAPGLLSEWPANSLINLTRYSERLAHAVRWTNDAAV